MLFEILLEALRYFDRAALEGLQIHSRYLRDFVKRHSRTLPLRYIHEVKPSCLSVLQIVYGDVLIRPMEGKRDCIDVMVSDGEDPEKLSHRVNNTFVRRLRLSFHQKCLPLLCHLRTNANDLQCQVGALDISGVAKDIDYALVDFLGVHLKPQIYESSVWSNSFDEHYIMLFKHSAFCGSVRHLAYRFIGSPAPSYLLTGLFGNDVLESCAMTTKVDPRPWIGQFVEMFEKASRGTDIVRSVTLLHQRFGKASPLRHAVDLLGKPRRTGMPPPQSAYIKEWSQKYFIRRTTSESTLAELFVFENAKSAKKLEVFVWTIEHSGTLTALHYAFLLKILDM